MNTQNITTNLADFCAREINILIDLLIAWRDQGLPDDFSDDEVVPMFNKESGHVFLTNEDCQAAMLNGDKLESWYLCPNCGHEGFGDTCKITDDGCNQCVKMKLKAFKYTFKKIRNCAFDLFENSHDRVEFIFNYLNNDFKKTYAFQTLNFAKDEYEYLCSKIDHVWDNLQIR